MVSAGKEVALIFGAFIITVATSIDDVLWLIPFVSSPKKSHREQWIFAIIYICVSFCITAGSIGVALGAAHLFYFLVKTEDNFWNGDRILGLVCGVLLLGFAGYLFYEWYYEEEDENEDEEIDDIAHIADKTSTSPTATSYDDLESQPLRGEDGLENRLTNNINNNNNNLDIDDGLDQKTGLSDESQAAENVAGNESETDQYQQLLDNPASQPTETLHHGDRGERTHMDRDERHEIQEAARKSTTAKSKLTNKKLIFISVLGSLDQFVVLSVMLLSGSFTWYQVVIGVIIATAFILSICAMIRKMTFIVRWIEKVPLWCITLVLAGYTVMDAFLI